MKSILFIELLGGIGDVLIALPAIQALGRSAPEAKLTVITFTFGAELLKHDPLIDYVIAIRPEQDKSDQSIRQQIEMYLKLHSFDLIVSDTNYGGIDQMIQQSGTAQVVTNLWRSPPPDQRVGDRFVQILLEEGVIQPESVAPAQLHLTTDEILHAQQQLARMNHPWVVLIPDAGMTIKRWSTAHFVTVGRALQHQYNAKILIPVGSDRQSALEIVNAIGGTAQIWERGTLREFATLLGQVDLVIAPDTGPARIAAALNTPTITLFGPSWSDRYGQPSPHINLQGHSGCPERNISNFTLQSCWYSGKCPFAGWQSCLDAISPAEVLSAAAQLLSIPPSIPYFPPIPHWSAAQNILVMRLDNIGDVLMTSPALRAIKETLPESRLTLMASPGGSQAAELLPWIDNVLPVRSLWQDLGKLEFNPEREWELIKSVRDRQFDAAIVFTSFSQTPHAAGYLCYLAGIPLRVGESKEWGGAVFSTAVSSAPDEMHQVERNLRLVESVGFQVSDRSLGIRISELAQQRAIEKLNQQGLHSPYVLLNPWTSCQSRNYSAERFALAARQLSEITGYRIVVTGVANDRQHSAPLLNILGDCAIDLIGETNLAELAALIANARLMLSNNTSTMHIADATRTPSVILFAGTEYECQWQPRHTTAQLLRQPTPCSPCYAFTCPYNLECLDIPPSQVVAAGLALLHASTPVLQSLS